MQPNRQELVCLGTNLSLMTPAELKIVDHWYPPHTTFPLHRDKTNKISIVLTGQLKEKAGAKEEYATSTSWVIKSKDVPHTDHFGPNGARIISFIFEENFLDDFVESQELVEWKWFHGLPYNHPVIQLLLNIHALQQTSTLTDHLTELFSWIENPSVEIPDKYPGWLAPILERIQDEYQSPLQVKELAEMVGIHPVYLARVFRKFHQCSIKDYIKRLRIHQVLDKLASTQISLVQIALEEGYADQSHFSRTFKAELGCTPAKFRRIAQGFRGFDQAKLPKVILQ